MRQIVSGQSLNRPDTDDAAVTSGYGPLRLFAQRQHLPGIRKQVPAGKGRDHTPARTLQQDCPIKLFQLGNLGSHARLGIAQPLSSPCIAAAGGNLTKGP
ncbi:hypothetical protein D3C75_1249630 [compost metagenome]